MQLSGRGVSAGNVEVLVWAINHDHTVGNVLGRRSAGYEEPNEK